jgi:hypothetical protein
VCPSEKHQQFRRIPSAGAQAEVGALAGRGFQVSMFDYYPQFQYGEHGCFHETFLAFVTVAREVNPRQYVGGGWNTSLTKVIDNALVGVSCDPRLLQQLRQTPAGDDLPRS